MKEAAIGIIVTFIIIVAIVVASRKQVHKEELDKTKIQDL